MGFRMGLLVRSLLLVVSAALVGCDHASKAMAQQELGGGRIIELVSGVLDLRYTENHDVAFSMLRDVSIPHKSWVLGSVSGIVLLGTLVAWWRRRRAPWPEPIGYALVVAGAVGNVIDRFTRGFVVDFIHLKHWPVFNVADVVIVVGIFVLGISATRQRVRRAEA